MEKYSIYKLTTGEIVRYHTGARPELSGEEGLINGILDNERFYVDGGEIHSIPPLPSKQHLFNFDTKKWELPMSVAIVMCKVERNKRLAESDWTQLADVPLSNKSEWATYRQSLRDITKQSGYPCDIVWPVKPKDSGA